MKKTIDNIDSGNWHKNYLQTKDQTIFYRYRQASNAIGNLLLLHGSGVNGELTYKMMYSHLHQFNLLVPDLRGAGYTSFPDGNEYPFLVSDVASDIMQLVNTIWPHRSFSICGYSYGAIVGLHLKPKLPILEHLILIDPPLIDAPDLKSRITERLPLTHIVQVLLEKEDPNEGLIAFADVILPHRKRHPKIENSLLQRLSFRPKGLAYCLNCVNQAALDLPCPSKLSQLENVHVLLAESRGMKSINSIKEQIPDWHVSYLNGTTHALPFQKPEKTAQFITRVLTNLN